MDLLTLNQEDFIKHLEAQDALHPGWNKAIVTHLEKVRAMTPGQFSDHVKDLGKRVAAAEAELDDEEIEDLDD